jgi:ribosomal-protein-alanine N-acetyltransferase
LRKKPETRPDVRKVELMAGIEIVKADISHVDGIIEVENLCFKIPWSREAFVQEITGNRFAMYFTAKCGDKVVGYAGMWNVCNEGHITNVAVHPEYRGKGVGSKLVEKLIEVSRQDGILRMTLEVRKSNLAAQHLYGKYGFQISGFRKSYYSDNGEDAIIMWKNRV